MAVRFAHAALLASLPAVALVAAPEDDRHVFDGALEISAIDVSSPFTTWLDHGEGKLRYDESDTTGQLSRAYLEYR